MPNTTAIHRAFPKLNRVLSDLRHADGHLADVIKLPDHTRAAVQCAEAIVEANVDALMKVLKEGGYQE